MLALLGFGLEDAFIGQKALLQSGDFGRKPRRLLHGSADKGFVLRLRRRVPSLIKRGSKERTQIAFSSRR